MMAPAFTQAPHQGAGIHPGGFPPPHGARAQLAKEPAGAASCLGRSHWRAIHAAHLRGIRLS